MKPGVPSLLLGGALALISAAPFFIGHHSGNGNQNPSAPTGSGRVSATARPGTENFVAEWTQLMNSGGEDAGLRAASCADRLAPSDCKTAAEYALKNEPTGKMLLSVISRWAEVSPADAMKWTMNEAPVTGHEDPVQAAAAGWAAINPGELESWLVSQTDAVKSKLAAPVAELLLKADPAAAIRMAQKFDLTFDKRTFSQCVKDAGSAQKILIQLKDYTGKSEKAVKLGRFCRELWAYNDPAGCVKWEAVNGTFSESALGTADYYVGTILQANDLPLGAESVLSLVEPDQLSGTLRALIQKWAPGAPEAAGSWLDSRPNTPDRWPAAAEYAVLCAETDINAAWQWAATVGDKTQRENAERQILLKWAGTDPLSAEARLLERGWPESEIQEIRERMATVERSE